MSRFYIIIYNLLIYKQNELIKGKSILDMHNILCNGEFIKYIQTTNTTPLSLFFVEYLNNINSLINTILFCIPISILYQD